MLAHNVYFALNDTSSEAVDNLVGACKKYLSDHPGVIRKIFFAGSDEIIHRLGRSIIQSEINIVRKHAVLPSYFVLSWKTET